MLTTVYAPLPVLALEKTAHAAKTSSIAVTMVAMLGTANVEAIVLGPPLAVNASRREGSVTTTSLNAQVAHYVNSKVATAATYALGSQCAMSMGW